MFAFVRKSSWNQSNAYLSKVMIMGINNTHLEI